MPQGAPELSLPCMRQRFFLRMAGASQGGVVSGKAFLPLDRQVPLVIGMLLLISSLLGYMFTPALFLFTGLIGAGLIIAGLKGFCGLAMLLAKLPWNQRT